MAYVMRLYISKRQAFTSHIVRICICSTTRTSFDPYTRESISCWEKRETSSPGAIRLLLVFTTMCMTAIRTVSVACIGVNLGRISDTPKPYHG